MSETTRTVNDMISDLTREIKGHKAQMVAFCEPIKIQIKEKERQLDRLLLEDGRQIVDGGLFGGQDDN